MYVVKHHTLFFSFPFKSFLERIVKQPCNDLCVIAQGTGLVAGLHLVDYYLQMTKIPAITLIWFVRERNAAWEEILGLAKRQNNSKGFQYLIVSDVVKKDDAPMSSNDLKGDPAMQTFLQRYQSTGSIVHERSVDALLSLIASPGEAGAFNDTPQSDVRKSSRRQKLRDFSTHSRLTQHMGGKNDIVFALCGHPAFENDMSAALQNAMLAKEQIYTFKEGTTPYSQVPEFMERQGNTAGTGYSTPAIPNNPLESSHQSKRSTDRNTNDTANTYGPFCLMPDLKQDSEEVEGGRPQTV